MPQQWSIRELEAMDETAWRIYLSMRLDDIDSTVAPTVKRCAARATCCPTLKTLIATLVSALLGVAAWLAAKVYG